MKFISLLFLLLCLPSIAQNSHKTEILAACDRITSVQCDFVQTKKSALLSEDIVSTGKMDFAKPNHLEWEYVSPLKFKFIMDGQNASLEKDGKAEAVSPNQNRIVREISKLVISNIDGSFLSDKMFRTAFSDCDDEIVAELFPLNKEMKKMWTKFVLHYAKDTYLVKTFELYEANGDLTTIAFKNCRYGFK